MERKRKKKKRLWGLRVLGEGGMGCNVKKMVSDI